MAIIDLKTPPNCYGDREQAWDKCEECDYILKCSHITLTREFNGVNIVSNIFPRLRCPKTGRYVSEWNCMFCENPPNDDYEACSDFNSGVKISNLKSKGV